MIMTSFGAADLLNAMAVGNSALAAVAKVDLAASFFALHLAFRAKPLSNKKR